MSQNIRVPKAMTNVEQDVPGRAPPPAPFRNQDQNSAAGLGATAERRIPVVRTFRHTDEQTGGRGTAMACPVPC